MAYLGETDRVDGSWELNILVTDLQVERTLRVMGDLHIGGVMVKLVDALGKTDFSLTETKINIHFYSKENRLKLLVKTLNFS